MLLTNFEVQAMQAEWEETERLHLKTLVDYDKLSGNDQLDLKRRSYRGDTTLHILNAAKLFIRRTLEANKFPQETSKFKPVPHPQLSLF